MASKDMAVDDQLHLQLSSSPADHQMFSDETDAERFDHNTILTTLRALAAPQNRRSHRRSPSSSIPASRSPPSPVSTSPPQTVLRSSRGSNKLLRMLSCAFLDLHSNQQRLTKDLHKLTSEHEALKQSTSERFEDITPRLKEEMAQLRAEQAAQLGSMTLAMGELAAAVRAPAPQAQAQAPQSWRAALVLGGSGGSGAGGAVPRPAQAPPRAAPRFAPGSEPEAAASSAGGPALFPAPFDRRALLIGVPVEADMAELRNCLQNAAAVGDDLAVEAVLPLLHTAAPGRDGGGTVHLVEVHFTSAAVMGSAMRNFRFARLPYTATMVESVPPDQRTTRNHRRERLKNLPRDTTIKATVMGIDFYYKGPPPPPGSICKGGWIWAPSFEALRAVALAHPLPLQAVDVETAPVPVGPAFGARPSASPTSSGRSRSRSRSPRPPGQRQRPETGPRAPAPADMHVDGPGLGLPAVPATTAPSVGDPPDGNQGGLGGGA